MKTDICFQKLNHLQIPTLHWQVGAEIPMDSKEAEEESKQAGGKTLLYVLERGYLSIVQNFHCNSRCCHLHMAVCHRRVSPPCLIRDSLKGMESDTTPPLQGSRWGLRGGRRPTLGRDFWCERRLCSSQPLLSCPHHAGRYSGDDHIK